jgi:eukaryotic-like serine/threonine-protein kinase
MEDDPRILEILEGLLESGGTPEEACADCPELLSSVRQQWERCRRLEARFDEVFPSSASTASGAEATLASAVLPRIPGYEVEAVVGRGGMGIVYRARHVGLNRTIALKMLLSGAYASPLERARFLREAHAVASLRHPAIVQVHDVGEVDGRRS